MENPSDSLEHRPNDSEIGDAAKPRIVLSGVNLVEMGPLAVFRDALASIAAEHAGRFEIVALVHRRTLFDVPNITYLEFPDVKSSWLKRLRFEYRSSKEISRRLKPEVWLSMQDMTPNVCARVRAVYCQNPSPFYRFRLSEALSDWKFGLFTLFYRFLYRINIHKNDFVIVQQDWMRQQFRRLYSARNVVVAHPALESPNPMGTGERRDANAGYRFFFPSFPRTFKNLEACLEAAQILEGRGFSRFELWLTVDASVNRYAARLVKQFSGLKSIRWLGLLPRARVFELEAQADCLLFPSRIETWGMPITEFRALDKPIIVSDLPYAHETASGHEQVAFFNPDDPRKLADLMEGAATGQAVFAKAAEIGIAEPFARNWSELWSLLLGDANRKT